MSQTDHSAKARPTVAVQGYVELHARSAFSFLRGGSLPDELVNVAARLGLPGLAICDRNGVYGSVRQYITSKEAGLKAIVGCELVMEDDSIVPVLVATQAGYKQLCSLLTTAHLRAPKGEGRVTWDELTVGNGGLFALTGDEEGPVRRAWKQHGTAEAGEAAQRLLGIFGRERLYAEIQRHLIRGEERENRFVTDWAQASGVPLLATNGVRYATSKGRTPLDVFTCLRNHVTLDQAGRLLSPNDEARLKSAKQMCELFTDLPDAIGNTARLTERVDFTLANLGYRFPDYPAPEGQHQNEFLRKVTFFGAHQRYGSATGRVRIQLDRELELITKLGFSGYFLMVWDLCAFARERGILVQGRGSAANSAVCYSLGITAVDPIGAKLLFERFLSEGRSDWPDIDLDFPSGDRRETVIQEVYRKYGRTGTAMTANVITYRDKIAMREVGKVFGLSDDVLGQFSALFHHGDLPETMSLQEQASRAGLANHPRQAKILEVFQRVVGLPRHLGQHSGGMVISPGNLSEFVPLENASMVNRSVIQWDKSDCEEMGIVKVDILGLGMVAAIQDALEICAERGQPVDLAGIPKDDPATFAAIQAADTVGMFQIESRAQMATLPRMRPANFYDLAVEVAIIRPGPIQGEATNPYLNRRQGKEPVTYMDERLKPILERTLGVVIFQEQILRIAMELAGFSAAEADELRRAIGFTRSPERLERMEKKLHEALLANGVTEAASDSIRKSLGSFALYGFPESHAISFALIAYSSAWLRVHHPTAFYAGILNNLPMGFYSAVTLVQDARRHGIKVLPVCVQNSQEKCSVLDDATFRLGLCFIKGLKDRSIANLLRVRREKPFSSMVDFMRRAEVSERDRRSLAAAGALNELAGHRRAAMWEVENKHLTDDLFKLVPEEEQETDLSPLKEMSHLERVQADFAVVGLTTGRHPMALMRSQLPELWSADALKKAKHGERLKVGGSVITRQRPGTAKGFCFITLEDETGHINAIVRPQLFEKLRMVINMESCLIITGQVQNEDGVIHVMAQSIEPMPSIGMPGGASHDYH